MWPSSRRGRDEGGNGCSGARRTAAGGVEVAAEGVTRGGRGVKVRNAAGAVQPVADVVEPDDLAVGGVEERNPVVVDVDRAFRGALRVALGLGQDVLRAEGDLLGLDD